MKHQDVHLNSAEPMGPAESFDHESVTETGKNKYRSMLERLRKEGRAMRSDIDQPKVGEKPTWFQAELFENAKVNFQRHFTAISFAHLSGLLLLVRIDSIFDTLIRTGRSDTVSKLFKRYYHTVIRVKSWYEGDIFDPNSDAQRQLMIVRGMHNSVSTKLNGHTQANSIHSDETKPNNQKTDHAETDGNTEPKSVYISQYDILITQFAFVGLIVTHTKKMGLMSDFSRHDLESTLHFWRVIGYYLGAKDEMNLCSYEFDDIVGLCDVILEDDYKNSLLRNRVGTLPGVMSLNIVRAMRFLPILTFYGITRYLYELLGVATDELQDWRTWYSNFSYKLTKILMSNLLGYRLLRAFNNGLTRFSVWLIGKVERWNTNRLNRYYGQEPNA